VNSIIKSDFALAGVGGFVPVPTRLAEYRLARQGLLCLRPRFDGPMQLVCVTAVGHRCNEVRVAEVNLKRHAAGDGHKPGTPIGLALALTFAAGVTFDARMAGTSLAIADFGNW
jgi:hypothetical protein